MYGHLHRVAECYAFILELREFSRRRQPACPWVSYGSINGELCFYGISAVWRTCLFHETARPFLIYSWRALYRRICEETSDKTPS